MVALVVPLGRATAAALANEGIFIRGLAVMFEARALARLATGVFDPTGSREAATPSGNGS